MKNLLESILRHISLKRLFLGLKGKKQNLPNSQFAIFSQTSWDIIKIQKLAYQEWKINWSLPKMTFLLFIAKNEICEIFREPDEIFKKFKKSISGMKN